MPSRVTLTDAKRQSWFDDLANPDVPLYKLGKNVPHGAKGHDLLELLHSSNVAIPRAIWLLRVLGANETVGVLIGVLPCCLYCTVRLDYGIDLRIIQRSTALSGRVS